MANFTYFIRERVKINGVERGTNYEATISDVNHADNRVMTLQSGSMVDIVKLDDIVGAGTFVSSSLAYLRLSNHSTGSVNVQITGSAASTNLLLEGKGTLMLNTEFADNTFSNFEYGSISSIKAQPVESTAVIEYFVVTT